MGSRLRAEDQGEEQRHRHPYHQRQPACRERISVVRLCRRLSVRPRGPKEEEQISPEERQEHAGAGEEEPDAGDDLQPVHRPEADAIEPEQVNVDVPSDAGQDKEQDQDDDRNGPAKDAAGQAEAWARSELKGAGRRP